MVKVSSLKPYNKRVLIKVDTEIEKMKNGLYVPEASLEKPNTGEVVTASEELEDWVGRRVMFNKYGGSEFVEDDVEYRLVKDDEILAYDSQRHSG